MNLLVQTPVPCDAEAVERPSSNYGGTLRLGWYGEPAPLDPFNVTETISTPLMDLIFNRLVYLDADGSFKPDLAERWEVSADGLLYTF